MKRLLIAIILCAIPAVGLAFFGGSGGGKKLPTGCSDSQIPVYSASTLSWSCGDPGAASMVYPGAGVALSTGSAWGTSLNATNLGAFAAINPSTNVKSMLSAANYAAIKTLLGYYTSGDAITGTFTGGLTGDVTGNVSGYAASLKSPATTGVAQLTGMGTGTTRVKTVRDANDTVLELGGSYTPTGTWDFTSLTGTWPTWNQNTTGTAANLSGTPALPNGTTATTQAKSDNSTKLATTAFVMAQTNTATSAGIVATGAGQVNKVWKTDADGVPGWADDATGGTPTFDTVGTGTNVSATMTVGTGGSLTYANNGVVNASQFRGVTAVDATEFGYVDGVTSAIQTQLNAKAPSTSPTLVTPTLGVATATSINKMAITAPATSSTLAVADGKTFTASNTLTLAGTDGTTMTFPGTSATIARTDAANTFTGHQTIEGVTSTGATGTGKFVFDTSPTLVTPTIGVATATSVNKMAITAPATGSTLAVADGKTATISNTLTLAGTDGSTLNVGTGGTLGTAAYTAATAYQGAHASLTSIAGLTETAGGLQYTSADNTYADLAIGAAGTLLRSSGSAPAWSTLTMPTTIASGSVFAANSVNTLSAINSTTGTKFLQNADGVISWATGVGTIAGSTGSADNALITANGTGGSTIQANSATATLSDAGLLTVPTFSSGAGGFTVGADGDAVAKSVIISKASGIAGDVGLYESNSDDDETAGFKGPIATITGNMDNNASYRGVFPAARPTSGTRNAMVWTGTSGAGDGTPTSPYSHAMSFLNLDTTYAALAGATFAGKVNTPAASASANGFNIGQGTVCATSGTNGDLCITASGLYATYGGSTVGPFSTGAPGFGDVTAGTNTNALVIGNGGSLAATGTGTITATAAPLAGITGAGANVLTALATPSSANLASAITDETGTGSAVFANTPTLVTPVLGAATATSVAFGADPADSGAVRFSNNTAIGWEQSTPGTDVFIALDGSDILQVGQNAAQINLGTSGTGNVAVTGDLTVTGSDVSVGAAGVKLTGDGDGAITFLGMGDGSDEDLTMNFDDTANTVSVSSSTGVTDIGFGSLNLVTTGNIAGGVKRIGSFASPTTSTGTYSLTAANSYNSVIFYNDTDTLALPAAVAGMSVCVYVTGTNLTTIDPNGTDVIVVDGTANAAGDAFTVAGVAGNFVCLVADAANHWITLGAKGTLTAL